MHDSLAQIYTHTLLWYGAARDNCAPYYSKCCCDYVNGNKLPPDERLKRTKQMTVPWVPPKEGELHISWLWLHPVPWAYNQACTGRTKAAVTTTTILTISPVIACGSISVYGRRSWGGIRRQAKEEEKNPNISWMWKCFQRVSMAGHIQSMAMSSGGISAAHMQLISGLGLLPKYKWVVRHLVRNNLGSMGVFHQQTTDIEIILLIFFFYPYFYCWIYSTNLSHRHWPLSMTNTNT